MVAGLKLFVLPVVVIWDMFLREKVLQIKISDIVLMPFHLILFLILQTFNQEKMEKAYFASGCFWGTEYHFMKAEGVITTSAGYMGGNTYAPTYKEVCTGMTGHIETVEVVFNPEITSFEKMLQLYYETHDFEQVGGQGPDIGEQYQSVVFYVDDSQKKMVEKYIKILKDKGFKVATQLRPAPEFWEAEAYHQEYYDKKKGIPYCHAYKKIF